MANTCYLDTNIFLNVIYDEKLFSGSGLLLESIQAGTLSGITSSVTETEVAFDLANTGNRDKIDEALRLIERMENLTICPLDSYTARLAVKLVLDSGLGLLAATALENKAGIFVTRDKSLRNKLKNTINVLEPESIPKGA